MALGWFTLGALQSDRCHFFNLVRCFIFWLLLCLSPMLSKPMKALIHIIIMPIKLAMVIMMMSISDKVGIHIGLVRIKIINLCYVRRLDATCRLRRDWRRAQNRPKCHCFLGASLCALGGSFGGKIRSFCVR